MVLSPRGKREVNYVAEKAKARTSGTDAQFRLRFSSNTLNPKTKRMKLRIYFKSV
jgi:hypothetical protein